jgi:hypothetical protein
MNYNDQQNCGVNTTCGCGNAYPIVPGTNPALQTWNGFNFVVADGSSTNQISLPFLQTNNGTPAHVVGSDSNGVWSYYPYAVPTSVQNIAGGQSGNLVYQVAPSTTGFLSPSSTTGYVLTSNGTGSAPSWAQFGSVIVTNNGIVEVTATTAFTASVGLRYVITIGQGNYVTITNPSGAGIVAPHVYEVIVNSGCAIINGQYYYPSREEVIVTYVGSSWVTNSQVSSQDTTLNDIYNGANNWSNLKLARAKLNYLTNGYNGPTSANPFYTQQNSSGTITFSHLIVGDSVSGFVGDSIGKLLQDSYGYAGWGLDEIIGSGSQSFTAVPFATGQTNPAGATPYAYSNWWCNMYYVTSSQNNNWVIGLTSGSNLNPIFSDTFSVYYLKEPSAGSFKVQYDVNGNNTWTDLIPVGGSVATISAANSTLVGGVAKFTMSTQTSWTGNSTLNPNGTAQGQFRLRIVSVSGKFGFIGTKMYRTDINGVIRSSINNVHTDIGDKNLTPQAVSTPILADLAPDLATLSEKSDITYTVPANAGTTWNNYQPAGSVIPYATSLATFYQNVAAGYPSANASVPLTDWVVVSPNPSFAADWQTGGQFATGQQCFGGYGCATQTNLIYTCLNGSLAGSQDPTTDTTHAVWAIASPQVEVAPPSGRGTTQQLQAATEKSFALSNNIPYFDAATIWGSSLSLRTGKMGYRNPNSSSTTGYENNPPYYLQDGVHPSNRGALYLAQYFADEFKLGGTSQIAARSFIQHNGKVDLYPNPTPINGYFGTALRLRGIGSDSNNVNSIKFCDLVGSQRSAITENTSASTPFPSALVLTKGSALVEVFDNGSSVNGVYLGGNNLPSGLAANLTTGKAVHLANTATIYDGGLEIPSGGVAGNIRTITSSTSVSCGVYGQDSTILVDATSGNITLTLPSASQSNNNGQLKGRVFTFIRKDSTSNVVTINTSGGNINGASSTTLVATLGLVSDGSNYYTTGGSVLFVGKTVFVDSIFGTSSGQRQRADLPFNTISNAVAAAQSGDTIYIRTGAYTGSAGPSTSQSNLNFFFETGAVLTGNIYIGGAGAATTPPYNITISGDGQIIASGHECIVATNATAINVTVKNMTLTGTSSYGCASNAAGSSYLMSFQNCRFENSSPSSSVQAIYNTGVIKLQNCIVVAGTTATTLINGGGTANLLNTVTNMAITSGSPGQSTINAFPASYYSSLVV